MGPERAAGFPPSRGGLPRLAGHVSPGAAMALFTGTAVLWFLAARPGQSLPILWGPASERLSGEQVAMLLAAIVGVLVLLGGLFAIGVYLLNRPVVLRRQVEQQIRLAREELAGPGGRRASSLRVSRNCIAGRRRLPPSWPSPGRRHGG